MTIYVLFLVILASGSHPTGDGIISQEFSTLERCENAASMINKDIATNWHHMRYVCVPK